MLLRAHSQFISRSTFIFLFLKLPHGASIFFDTVIPHPPLGVEAVSSGSLRSFLSCGQLALEMGGLEASSARHRMPLDHRNAEENESLFRSLSCGLLCQSAGSLAIIHFYSSSWRCLCLLSDDIHSCRWYIRWSRSLHCFFGNFLLGFGVLTLHYDIWRFVFLLFVLQRARYWMHHGMICFERFFPP